MAWLHQCQHASLSVPTFLKFAIHSRAGHVCRMLATQCSTQHVFRLCGIGWQQLLVYNSCRFSHNSAAFHTTVPQVAAVFSAAACMTAHLRVPVSSTALSRMTSNWAMRDDKHSTHSCVQTFCSSQTLAGFLCDSVCCQHQNLLKHFTGSFCPRGTQAMLHSPHHCRHSLGVPSCLKHPIRLYSMLPGHQLVHLALHGCARPATWPALDMSKQRNNVHPHTS